MTDNENRLFLADVDEKLSALRARLEHNRNILEHLSGAGLLSGTPEGRWIRDTLARRADVLRHVIDQMQRVRACYLNNDSTISLRDEHRKMYGALLLDLIR